VLCEKVTASLVVGYIRSFLFTPFHIICTEGGEERRKDERRGGERERWTVDEQGEKRIEMLF
jgi:hypothetical protein